MSIYLHFQIALLLLSQQATLSFHNPARRRLLQTRAGVLESPIFHDQSHSSMVVMMTSSSTSSPSATRPWYSHPDLDRDRSRVLKKFPDDDGKDLLSQLLEGEHGVDEDSGSRFLLMSQKGMWHQSMPKVKPLYLTRSQLKTMLSSDISNSGYISSGRTSASPIVAWIGSHGAIDYWVVYVKELPAGNDDKLATGPILDQTAGVTASCRPLREFGDSLEDNDDAGILATAQGLVEFHKSHPFCSLCGAPTQSSKAGSCRRCSDCKKSVYPRLDVAAIMLVTSPCQKYALLGRKKSWPEGRYSTLAGFCEVGETLEDCCRRETYEESGVVVDPLSVQFMASQPWPFPRSLMVGFQAKALMGEKAQAAATQDSPVLPEIQVDTSEMEDIQWFSKDFVKERLAGGSTALTFEPNDHESIFHIPGKASLARLLITKWTEQA